MNAQRVVCACYRRTSKKEQNPENQVPDMERYCAQRNWQTLWYVEQETGSNNERPVFRQLVQDVFSGKAHAVLFWSLDRMGRDQVFLLTQVQAFEAAGIIVASCQESWLEGDDDSKPILLGVTSGMAASELRRLKKRTRAGLRQAVLDGKRLGRPPKAESLLSEAKRLVVGGGLSIRAAAKKVSRGLPKKSSHPGELTAISEATLRRYLAGTWKGHAVRHKSEPDSD